jgi:hypothetical protein
MDAAYPAAAERSYPETPRQRPIVAYRPLGEGASPARVKKRRSCQRPQAIRMDDRRGDVPGARDVHDVLRGDPLYRAVGAGLANPWVLGIVIALISIAMLLLGPSTESRFIYTDF